MTDTRLAGDRLYIERGAVGFGVTLTHGAGSLQKRLGRDGEGPESGRSPRPAAAVWEQFEDILELLGASGPARE